MAHDHKYIIADDQETSEISSLKGAGPGVKSLFLTFMPRFA